MLGEVVKWCYYICSCLSSLGSGGCNPGFFRLLTFVPKQARISFYAGRWEIAVKGTFTAVLSIVGSYKHQGVSWSLNKHGEILSPLGFLPWISEEAGFLTAVFKTALLHRLQCLSSDCAGLAGMPGGKTPLFLVC